MIDKGEYLISVEQRIAMPNLLLISGDKRNVGKTTVGCGIVRSLSGQMNVIAIKISPHFHLITDSLVILNQIDLFVISRETDKTSKKDSSRYLNSGASEVYYIQCKEQGLPMIAEWIHETFSDGTPVICESGGLLNLIIPGYYVHIKEGKENHQFNPGGEILFNNFHPEKINTSIKWENKKWKR